MAIVSLMHWTTDWGGLALLSRAAATKQPHRYYTAAYSVRLIVAFILLIFVTVAIVYIPFQDITRGVLVAATLSCIPWALNLAGYLDGLRLSRYSGPLSSVSWIGASIGILLINPKDPLSSGYVIGLLFSLGTVITVVYQHFLTKVTNNSIRLSIPTKTLAKQYCFEGFHYCVGGFPAQLYGRSLIFIVSASIDPQVTGAYVYIRQITNAISQFITILRRVEFPSIVHLHTSNELSFKNFLKAQSLSLVTSLFLPSSILIALYLVSQTYSNLMNEEYEIIVYYSFIFLPLILLWSATHSMGHLLISMEKTKLYSYPILVGSTFSMLLVFSLISDVGLLIIAISEALMYILISIYLSAIPIRSLIKIR